MLGTDDFSVFDIYMSLFIRDLDEQQRVEESTSARNIHTNGQTLGLSSCIPVTDLMGIFNPGFKE